MSGQDTDNPLDKGDSRLRNTSQSSKKMPVVSDKASDLKKCDSDSDPDLVDPPEILGFNFKCFKRFWMIQKILFVKFGSFSFGLFIFIVLVSLLEEYVIYQVGLVPSKFYQVLGDKDFDEFRKVTLTSLGIIVGIAAIKSVRQYLLKLLTVTWRQILCRKMHNEYLTDLSYYQINVLDKKIDNPDQRMTQDVDKFTATYCEILPRLIVAPFLLAYYTREGFMSTGWEGPVSSFGFFIVGAIFNKLLMNPVVRLVAEQEKCEGDFRFVHMKIRVHAESLAFQDASQVEREKANKALSELMKAQRRLYLRQFFLNISTNLFDYLGSILSYLIVAIPIFSGAYEDAGPGDIASLISKNSFIVMYLIFQFSQLVDSSVQITEVAGVTHRIAQLLERIKHLESYWQRKFLVHPQDPLPTAHDNLNQFESIIRERKNNESFNLTISADKEDPASSNTVAAWNLNKVTFSAPFRPKILVKDLSLTISAGESLLVVGASSVGKSSLLRILRGLWPYSSGQLTRFYPPGPQGVYYVPQSPFLTSGTLREQLAFPCRSKPQESFNENDLIHEYFEKLNLTPLLERVGGLDAPVPFKVYESLSPGEVQRICFIRVFLHRPVIAVFDEATSAMSLSMEEIVYSECIRLGITRISVGHRESLQKFHDALLTLDLMGGWTLEKIQHSNLNSSSLQDIDIDSKKRE